MDIKKEEPCFTEQVIKITHLPSINHQELVNYTLNSNKECLIERPLFENENKVRKTDELLKIKVEEEESTTEHDIIETQEVSWNTISSTHAESKVKLVQVTSVSPASISYFFQCSKCPLIFVSHMAMKEHSKTHGGHCKFVRTARPINITKTGNEYECKNCKKSFKSKIGLNHHIQFHNRKFSCYVCEKPFSSLIDLREHKLEHYKDGNTRILKCSACNYESPIKQNMDKHQERHSIFYQKIQRTKYYKCEKCPHISFRGLEALANHKKSAHS